ncbi:MAG TPA: protein kinase [Tepidisphaeraceae bacterium]|nr:protein kinase [Tepidisphaeraceae bacterium]
MPQLTAVQFRRVEELFFRASSLAPEQRDDFLATACADDPHVREEVRAMLSHSGGSGDGPGKTVFDDALASLVAAPASRRATDSLLRQLIGTRVGAYEFTDILGQGGMGVVYLARDVRLGRTVAIKALPPGLSRQTLRMSRFVREAKILASLSHPNIATVYGLEESLGTKFLVMEHVEGETLAKCIARGQLPIGEAVEVAREIACGVEAAHAAGVIHRDLKPGNVMFKADGKVKVLDFGLAREFGKISSPLDTMLIEGEDAAGAEKLTVEGSVIGTPGYMSPEQIRGKPVDRRTDIFALGCILYECLTGHLAFPGETGADIIAGILERDPVWNRLPPNTPKHLRRLLKRCLAKDVEDRARDMGDVRLELEDVLDAREWTAGPATESNPRPARRLRWARWAVAIGLSAALFALSALVLTSRRPTTTAAPEPRALRRFSLQFPQNASQSDLPHVRLALSRDGGRIVVSASDGVERHLWVRDRADTDFRKVDGTLNAAVPTLSPDGEWLAYFSDGVIWKRRVAGGNPVPVIDAAGPFGAFHWDADRQITYAPARGGGLARVAEEGGVPQFATSPRHDRGEYAHRAGCALPDGSAIIYTVRGGNADSRIEARHLASGRQYTVVERGSTPRIARTPVGTSLVWERAGTLYAAPFDPASMKLTGHEVAIADGVMVDRAGLHACYDVDDDGTLAFVPGPAFAEESRLAWVDPTDFEAPTEPLGDERVAFADPRFTSDGQRLSVVLKGELHRPFVYDLARRTLQRVMTHGDCASAAISPDGSKLAYVANKEGAYALWLKDLANGSEELLIDAGAGSPGEVCWSADGRWIAYSLTPGGSTSRDVWLLDLETKKASPFAAAADADERSPRFSPNGNWVAFVSNESGNREVYIKPLLAGKAARQVSTGSGGDRPEWTSDGRKLYYRGKGGLYLAPIAPNWADGTRPALVFRKQFGQSDSDLSDYAVAPDGRLLVVEPSERGPTVSQVTVVLNWHRLLDAAPSPVAISRR